MEEQNVVDLLLGGVIPEDWRFKKEMVEVLESMKNQKESRMLT